MTDMSEEPKVAYFSMEIALEPGMPTYSGGLGVLAGDTKERKIIRINKFLFRTSCPSCASW
jgi:hypothetical protein